MRLRRQSALLGQSAINPASAPTLGAVVRDWAIVGGDVMATKDFATQFMDGDRRVCLRSMNPLG